MDHIKMPRIFMFASTVLTLHNSTQFKSVSLYKRFLLPLLALLFSATLTLNGTNAYADVIDVSADTLTMNKELSEDVDRTLRHLFFNHYVRKQLNDEYSAKTLDNYLELLDPNKIYFTQDDVDRLQKYRFQIDDLLIKRDAEVGFDIFKIFRERMDARTKLIKNIIEQEFDYTVDENLNIDRDTYTWAANEKEIANKWRLRIKNDTLQQLMAETPIEEVRENLERRYQRQRDVIFQLKADEVFEWFMNAYAKEVGPHTQYMSHITAENFRVSMSLSLEGIGAALQTEQDYTVINRILPGGPAEKSGLIKPEDKVVAVGQDGEDMINVVGWRLTDVVQMIRGDKGTKVKLDIIKNDSAPGSPPYSLELVRDVIQLEDQAAKLSQIELSDGQKNHLYSVIDIPSFYSNSGQAQEGAKFKYTATAHDVQQLLKEVNESDSEGLIIDLRGNGGGYLNEAINLSGLFIDEGPVVQVIQSNQKRQVLKDKNDWVAYDGPMVVLIDRYSASASEIFAAAMQDYGRAIVVGERSFGKGTVQRVTPLRNGKTVTHESQIKLTTAQFFRVNGGSTQHKGVTPDILLNSGEEDEDFGERAYDNALPWSQTQAAIFKQTTIPGDLLVHLSTKHVQRSVDSPAFEFLRNTSKRIANNRDTKELSLNLVARQLRRNELEDKSLTQLNTYRKSLGLEAVTADNRSDNPLPDEDEHWNIVYHTEAARILLDQANWSNNLLTKRSE
jgi:carboxyl-terminal processing protease